MTFAIMRPDVCLSLCCCALTATYPTSNHRQPSGAPPKAYIVLGGTGKIDSNPSKFYIGSKSVKFGLDS